MVQVQVHGLWRRRHWAWCTATGPVPVSEVVQAFWIKRAGCSCAASRDVAAAVAAAVYGNEILIQRLAAMHVRVQAADTCPYNPAVSPTMPSMYLLVPWINLHFSSTG